MNKILFFDFDDTLSFNKNPVNYELIEELKRISYLHKVVIATGQSVNLIRGVLRQMGDMDNVGIIGENGADLLSNFKGFPEFTFSIKLSDENAELFKSLKENLIETYGENNLLFSEHKCALNVLPRFDCQREEIFDFFNKHLSDKRQCFKHCDTVELVFENVNKANGIAKFIELSGLERNNVEVHCFGDSENDRLMLEYSDYSYLIGNKILYNNASFFLADEKELIDLLKSNF